MQQNHKTSNANLRKASRPKRNWHKVTILGIAVVSLLNIAMTASWSSIRKNQIVSSGAVLGANVIAKQDGVQIYLGKTEFEEGKIPSFKPNVGNVFLVQKVTINNDTEKPINFLPSIQTYIRDKEGSIYTMRPTMVTPEPFEAGTIAAHSIRSGNLTYEVSKRLVGLKIYFDSGWGGRGPVVFDLNL